MEWISYFGAFCILKSLIFHNFASLFRLIIIKKDQIALYGCMEKDQDDIINDITSGEYKYGF
ncbi:MAG: hypothetical protein RBS38_15815, partial [Bacteroidales bacterium]|nr:hypothetical protein [Bacteroidales bacterium]